MAGADGRSLKAMAFRQADTALGQAMLGAGSTRRLWLAGRAKVDDWSAATSPNFISRTPHGPTEKSA